MKTILAALILVIFVVSGIVVVGYCVVDTMSKPPYKTVEYQK